jgi:hypothetical protein
MRHKSPSFLVVSYFPQILTENEINGNKEKIFLSNYWFKKKYFIHTLIIVKII